MFKFPYTPLGRRSPLLVVRAQLVVAPVNSVTNMKIIINIDGTCSCDWLFRCHSVARRHMVSYTCFWQWACPELYICAFFGVLFYSKTTITDLIMSSQEEAAASIQARSDAWVIYAQPCRCSPLKPSMAINYVSVAATGEYTWLWMLRYSYVLFF